MQKNTERNTQILSLTSLITPFLLLPVVGIVTGHVALKEYKNNKIDKSWRPLAVVGLISSYIILGLKLIGILFFTSMMFLGALLGSISMKHDYGYYDHPHHGYMQPYDQPYFTYPYDGGGMYMEDDLLLEPLTPESGTIEGYAVPAPDGFVEKESDAQPNPNRMGEGRMSEQPMIRTMP